MRYRDDAKERVIQQRERAFAAARLRVSGRRFNHARTAAQQAVASTLMTATRRAPSRA
jgi:hypothetical protein